MTELTEAINKLDPSLYNRIRAKVAQSLRADRKIEGFTEPDVERAIIKVLDEWATPKKK